MRIRHATAPGLTATRALPKFQPCYHSAYYQKTLLNSHSNCLAKQNLKQGQIQAKQDDIGWHK